VSEHTTPAGWFPDHRDPALLRWWDGERWTDRMRPLGSTDDAWAADAGKAPPTDTVHAGRPPGSGLRTVVLVLIFAAGVGVAGLWLSSALSDADPDDGVATDLFAPTSDVVVYVCNGATCPTATDDEIAALEAALGEDPDIERLEYVSERESWERFADLFEDDPELLDEVDHSLLPPSYELWIRDGADPITVLLRYRELPGVDDAIAPVVR
jgi:hypothetical protein